MLRGIDTSAAVLPFHNEDENQPHAGRLVTALRQIGYSLEQAIADLVDNSINAGAQNVLIRFMHDGDNIKALAIVDDGSGMTDARLLDAMRFGSKESDDPLTLGKFGMGMKLASLSHAQKITVLTRTRGNSAGRQWTVEGIADGWRCERICRETASELLNKPWGRIDLHNSGTLVIWEDIDSLPAHKSGLRHTLSAIERRLRLHLGLCFHRFIESGRVSVWLDQLAIDRNGQGLQSRINALNPFAYSESGHPAYPKEMSLELTGVGELKAQVHIWPAKCDAEEYRLGRRASSRQGFYFYRNDRLIQTGGWNGLVQDETEPHSSLARVAIDLPAEYDQWFSVNVQKSSVQAPPVFAEIFGAKSADGTSFDDFRRDAVEIYRSANSKTDSVEAFPMKGVSAFVASKLRALYAKDEDKGGFGVSWRRLPASEFFRVDSENAKLFLNSEYRKYHFVTSQEGEVLKLLVALLMRHDFRRPPGKSREKELRELNEILVGLLE